MKKVFNSVKLYYIDFIRDNDSEYRATFYIIFNINRASFFHYN